MNVTEAGSRFLFTARQAGVVAICLLVAGSIVSQLRPSDVVDRGSASTPFVWAAVVWAITLIVHAVVTGQRRTTLFEREPLWLATTIAATTFTIAAFNLSSDSFGREIVYLAGLASGWLVFWWAVASLVRLLVIAWRWARRSVGSRRSHLRRTQRPRSRRCSARSMR